MSTSTFDQHQAWTAGQAADQWYLRNKAKIGDEAPLVPSTRLFSQFVHTGERVLEIGTANGHQLHKLQRLTGCHGFGIDPSAVAIAEGSASYPDLALSVGTADHLDFPDAHFDAVIFGFCLYLVDRARLLRVVAEADRVLRRGGRLMIVDFDPTAPHRRAFAHQAGVWSYKMDYSRLWLASPDYAVAAKLAFGHDGEGFQNDPGERVGAWVLVKQAHDHAYPEGA